MCDLPANYHQLLDGRILAHEVVDVHGEERARTVEDGSEIAHEGCQHDRHHDTTKT